jgi:hypothetical protein
VVIDCHSLYSQESQTLRSWKALLRTGVSFPRSCCASPRNCKPIFAVVNPSLGFVIRSFASVTHSFGLVIPSFGVVNHFFGLINTSYAPGIYSSELYPVLRQYDTPFGGITSSSAGFRSFFQLFTNSPFFIFSTRVPY